MQGRPIPIAIKKQLSIDGIHDSGKRVIPDEPKTNPGIPKLPMGLSSRAKKAYKKFSDELEIMRVVTNSDRAALVMLAEAWADLEIAQEFIDKEGYITTQPNGVTCANPYVKIKRDAHQQVHNLLKDFGLTPVARTKLATLPEKSKGDDWF